MRRALALIDGEHYAPVVRDALAELPYDFVAACVVGGTEKLKGGDEYGVPVVEGVDEAIDRFDPDVAVDLSDEPVLGPRERLALASRVLARGLRYEGPDFRFDPPELEPFPLPSISIVGTGKRLGKTAITATAARVLGRDRRLVVVSMGRGGPAQPELAEPPVTVEDLLELARSGRHAASDYLETAALAGVTTVGCRRCGGGLAGTVATSNVSAGMELARSLEPDLVVFDGSGAALPPVATDRRLLVVGAAQEPALVCGYLNAYRILVSDLVVLTAAEDADGCGALRREILEVKPDATVVATMMRPRPVEPVEGKRVAYFTTAKEDAYERLARHLVEEHGAADVQVCGNLARRDALRRDLERLDADVYLTELKAAGIDVVAEAGVERGVEVVLADNEVLPLPGEPDLEEELARLAEGAAERVVV